MMTIKVSELEVGMLVRPKVTLVEHHPEPAFRDMMVVEVNKNTNPFAGPPGHVLLWRPYLQDCLGDSQKQTSIHPHIVLAPKLYDLDSDAEFHLLQ